MTFYTAIGYYGGYGYGFGPVSYTHLDVYKRQELQEALERLLQGKWWRQL